MQTVILPASVHGRYLYEDRGADRLLVAFHGYGETAEASFAEVEKIPGIGRWSVAAVQGLHPFYTRSGDVVASWMTRLDREQAISDNIQWVRTVVNSLPRPQRLVYLGFSQGTAMAARAAAKVGEPAGLVLLGGDIPPDVQEDATLRLPPVLLGRGSEDTWYTDKKFKNDLKFLEARTRVTTSVFSGGHEWSEVFRAAVGEFLTALE